MADMSKVHRGIQSGQIDRNRLNQKTKDDLFKYQYSIGAVDKDRPLKPQYQALIPQKTEEEKKDPTGFFKETGFVLGGIGEGAKQIYSGIGEKAPAAVIGGGADVAQKLIDKSKPIEQQRYEAYQKQTGAMDSSILERISAGATRSLKDISAREQARGEKLQTKIEEQQISKPAQHFRDIAQMGTEMTPALLTGNVGFLAPQILGSQTQRGIERGKDISESLSQAIPRTIMEVALEKMPLEKMGDLFKVGKKVAGKTIAKKGIKEFGKRTLKAAVPEMIEESISGVGNDIMDTIAFGDDFDLGKSIKGASFDALSAGEMVLVMSMLGVGVRKARTSKMNKVQKDMTTTEQQEIEALESAENVIAKVKSQVEQGQIQPSEARQIINNEVNSAVKPMFDNKIATEQVVLDQEQPLQQETQGKIKLFHGSDATFDKIRGGKAQAGEGVFLTDNLESSKEYGNNTYEIEIEPKKIATSKEWYSAFNELQDIHDTNIEAIENEYDDGELTTDEYEDAIKVEENKWIKDETSDLQQNSKVSNLLKQKGYDVLVEDMQSGDEGKEYQVLDETIIKSTKNINEKRKDILPSQIIEEKTPAKLRERKHTQTLKSSPFISKKVKEQLKVQEYEPITPVEKFEEAMTRVEANNEAEYADYMRKEGNVNADDVIQGEALMKYYSDIGNVEKAVDISEKLVNRATGTAQALQAHALMSKHTPAGMISYAQRQMKTIQDKMGDRYTEIQDNINKSMTEIEKAIETSDMEALQDGLLKLNLQFFAKKLNTTVDNLPKLMRTTKKDLGLRVNDIMKSSNSIEQAQQKMDDYLKETMPEAEYNKVSEGVQQEFNKMLEKSKESRRRMLLKDRPKYVRKGDFEKLLSYSALGEAGKPYLRDIVAKKFNSPELSIAEADYIMQQMKEAEKLPEGREKDKHIAHVYNVIKNKQPKSLRGKIAALQRVNLLMNVVTQTRNLGSNVGMQAIETLTDVPGAFVDKIVARKTGQRSVAMPQFNTENAQKMLDNFKAGAAEVVDDYKEGIVTDFDGGKYDITGAQAFSGESLNIKGVDIPMTAELGKMINQLDSFTTMVLRMGDVPFQKASEAAVLQQIMRANNVTEPTNDMRLAAKEDALKRVFQNNSNLAKISSKLRNVGSGADAGIINQAAGAFVQTQVPFMKTVTNIIDTGYEYAGGGFIKAIQDFKNLKAGDIPAQRKFVKELSRSLTTLGTMALGYALSKAGFIQGDLDDNKKVRTMQQKEGVVPYSIKVGDTYHSFDWIEPASLGLAIGADIYSKTDVDDSAASKIMIGVTTMMSTGLGQVGKHPIVSQMRDFMQELGYAYKDDELGSKIPSILGGKALQSVTQFAPSLYRQGMNLADPVKRDVWSGSPMEVAKKQIQSYNPWQRKNIPAKTNPFGEELKYSEGISNPFFKIFNTFVNPSKVGKRVGDKTTNEILDVYNKTKDKDMLPKNPPNKFKIGATEFKLDKMDKIKYQTFMGEQLKKSIETLIENENYMNASPDVKASILKQLVTSAQDLAKSKYVQYKMQDKQ